MPPASLDDFMALNDELAALVAAGVPLDVGLERHGDPATRALERINATVIRRVSRGESLDEALEGYEQDIPAPYRSMMQLGLRTGDLSAALDGSNRVAAAVDGSRYVTASAFLYPLIVLCLIYAGMIVFCLYFVPTLEAMYVSLRRPPGPALQILQVVRDTLPYWVVILPLALLVAAWLLFRRPICDRSSRNQAGFLAWLPGAARTVFQQRCATFSASLAALLDAGTPLGEALSIAADVCGESDLRKGGQILATALQSGQLPADDSPAAMRFPPFLRWALWHSEATIGRGRALKMAVNIYRESAIRSAARLQTIAPLVTLILLGGGITLLYGLALFVPLVELLLTLAK